ncbi:MAG: cation diffusion facilitator family transporter [bacterium]|nr:cation diffusion facilitator family transporter [bacterium]
MSTRNEQLEKKIRDKKWVAFTSILAAISITFAKLFVGIQTNSLGILAEAAHSALDLIAAIVTFFAVHFSDKPADAKHHYGHGKIENVSALFETILLVITCVWIFYEATERLVSGKSHVQPNVWAFAVILFSILVDLSRSKALTKVAQRYNSQALEADALHFSSDVWSSIVVLLGLGFVSFGYIWVDSIAAMIVAVFVLIACYRLGKRSIDALIDISLPQNETDWLHHYFQNLPKPVNGYHGLRTRMSGSVRYIDVDLEMDQTITIQEAHILAEKVISDITTKFPEAKVHIHTDISNDEHLHIH